MSTQQPLTTYLAASCPASLEAATVTSPFLELAAKGQITKHALSQWLTQDRLYAQCYIRFAGSLLSKVRLPIQHGNTSTPRLYERIMDILIDALVNVRQELELFGRVADKYGLDLISVSDEQHHKVYQHCCFFKYPSDKSNNNNNDHDGDGSGTTSNSSPCPNSYINVNASATTAAATSITTTLEDIRTGHDAESSAGPAGDISRGCNVFHGPNPITKAYTDLFMSAASSGVSLLEGMVVLWATEVCYLRAWRHVRKTSDETMHQSYGDVDLVGDAGLGAVPSRRGEHASFMFDADSDGGALRETLVPNWSSDDFAAFVERIGNAVDELAGQEIKGAEQIEIMRGRCLEWWRQILWLEEKFWPDV